jgi:hypothetical protein
MYQITKIATSKRPVDIMSSAQHGFNFLQLQSLIGVNHLNIGLILILTVVLQLNTNLYSQTLPTKVSIDSNFIYQVDSLVLLKETQDWSDSLDKGKGYDDKNIKIYKVAHSTIKNLYFMSRHFYLDPEDVKHKTIYFGYLTDISEPHIDGVNKNNKIPIHLHRKLLNDNIETLNVDQSFDDKQLLESIIKTYPMEHCVEETEIGFEFLYSFTPKKIHNFFQKRFKKYKLTELVFRTSTLKIQYFKIERMINKQPYTIAIEITLTPLSL